MCDWPNCEHESVCLIDLDPRHATVDRPLVDDVGPVLDDDGTPRTYPLAIGTQRVSYCVAHSAQLKVSKTLSVGHLTRDRVGNPLPEGHALASTWRWVLDG